MGKQKQKQKLRENRAREKFYNTVRRKRLVLEEAGYGECHHIGRHVSERCEQCKSMHRFMERKAA